LRHLKSRADAMAFRDNGSWVAELRWWSGRGYDTRDQK
jgi:hypothetical protein